MRSSVILATAFVLLCAVPAVSSASLNSRFGTNDAGEVIDPQINDVASQLVGRAITVHCVPPVGTMSGWSDPTFDDAGNQVGFDPDIFLDGKLCGALDKLINNDRRWLASIEHIGIAGEALLAITHESNHIRLNSLDEATVECSAVYRVWGTIKIIGVTGAWLRSALLTDAQNAHLSLPADYRAGCSFDLTRTAL